MLEALAKRLFGSANDRVLKSFENSVAAINDLEPALEALSDDDLRARTDTFRERLKGDDTIDDILDDAFATGSSIMPQKKNPDVAELARGKSARVIGNLVQALTMLKGQPLAYNKDLQEDKESLFDSVDTLLTSTAVVAAMLPTLEFDAERGARMAVEHFALATDVADYLQMPEPFVQHEIRMEYLQAIYIGYDWRIEPLDLTRFGGQPDSGVYTLQEGDVYGTSICLSGRVSA